MPFYESNSVEEIVLRNLIDNYNADPNEMLYTYLEWSKLPPWLGTPELSKAIETLKKNKYLQPTTRLLGGADSYQMLPLALDYFSNKENGSNQQETRCQQPAVQINDNRVINNSVINADNGSTVKAMQKATKEPPRKSIILTIFSAIMKLFAKA